MTPSTTSFKLSPFPAAILDHATTAAQAAVRASVKHVPAMRRLAAQRADRVVGGDASFVTSDQAAILRTNVLTGASGAAMALNIMNFAHASWRLLPYYGGPVGTALDIIQANLVAGALLFIPVGINAADTILGAASAKGRSGLTKSTLTLMREFESAGFVQHILNNLENESVLGQTLEKLAVNGPLAVQVMEKLAEEFKSAPAEQQAQIAKAMMMLQWERAANFATEPGLPSATGDLCGDARYKSIFQSAAVSLIKDRAQKIHVNGQLEAFQPKPALAIFLKTVDMKDADWGYFKNAIRNTEILFQVRDYLCEPSQDGRTARYDRNLSANITLVVQHYLLDVIRDSDFDESMKRHAFELAARSGVLFNIEFVVELGNGNQAWRNQNLEYFDMLVTNPDCLPALKFIFSDFGDEDASGMPRQWISELRSAVIIHFLKKAEGFFGGALVDKKVATGFVKYAQDLVPGLQTYFQDYDVDTQPVPDENKLDELSNLATLYAALDQLSLTKEEFRGAVSQLATTLANLAAKLQNDEARETTRGLLSVIYSFLGWYNERPIRRS